MFSFWHNYFRSVKTGTTFILLLLFLASCSNYNNIRFVNSGDFKASDKVVEESKDEELEVPVETPPCDTIYLTNGEINFVKVAPVDDRYIMFQACDWNKRQRNFEINLKNINSISYANGHTWVNKNVQNLQSSQQTNRKRISGPTKALIITGAIILALGILFAITFFALSGSEFWTLLPAILGFVILLIGIIKLLLEIRK